MHETLLGYGRAALSFAYDETRWQILAPAAPEEKELTDAEIGAALDEPISGAALEEIVGAGESALIVVSDATRATGSERIVNLLARRLITAGVAPGDIRVIFANGIHRAVTPDEQQKLLTPFITQRLRVLNHNALDPAQRFNFGATPRGTPVLLNRALREHDHVILTGSVSWHYFAGFSGGRKSVCPGLASAETIAATHALAMDFTTGQRRSGVGIGLLAGNAVHEECEAAATLVKPSFLVNTHTDAQGRVTRVYAGDWRAAHTRACEDYAAAHSVKIAEKRPLVVASCGGFPFDINLIQAHKTLDTAAHACADGGTIILLAECSEGLGRADFLQWFDAPDARQLALNLRDNYAVNGQTAWALLAKAERFRVVLVSSLPAEDARRMRLMPATNLAKAMAYADPHADGYLLPRGAAVLPVSHNAEKA
jgi:nickel-dependent lactate racemase